MANGRQLHKTGIRSTVLLVVGAVADVPIAEFDVYEALKLDGGGSTTPALDGKIVNVSSDDPKGGAWAAVSWRSRRSNGAYAGNIFSMVAMSTRPRAPYSTGSKTPAG